MENLNENKQQEDVAAGEEVSNEPNVQQGIKTPTIGDKVKFHEDSVTADATVTHVHSGKLVNLIVESGTATVTKTSVYHESEKPEGGTFYWTWPE